MTDIFKAIRQHNEMLSGFTPEEVEAMTKIGISHPEAKFTVPTPGTEAKLNGVTVDDVAKVAAGFAPGTAVTKREIIEGLGGNPKSSRDAGKVAKVLPNVPELEIHAGQKSQILRRLT